MNTAANYSLVSEKHLKKVAFVTGLSVLAAIINFGFGAEVSALAVGLLLAVVSS